MDTVTGAVLTMEDIHIGAAAGVSITLVGATVASITSASVSITSVGNRPTNTLFFSV